MMTLCSWIGGEAHPFQHSTQPMEPPARTSNPPLDKGVKYHRGPDEWGNSMGGNHGIESGVSEHRWVSKG